MGSKPSKSAQQDIGDSTNKINADGKPDEDQDHEDQESVISEDDGDNNSSKGVERKKYLVGKSTNFENIRDITEEIMDAICTSKDFSEAGILTKLIAMVKIYFAMRRTRRDELNEVCTIMLNKGLLESFVRMWDHFHQNIEEFYGNTTHLNFKIMKQMKSLLWNYTDKCEELSSAIQKNADVVKRLMKELTLPELGVDNLKKQQPRFMIKATLFILINAVRHCNKIKTQIRKNDGIDVLLGYEKSTFLIVKAAVYILLAYCITEQENEKIMTGSGVIGFIVNLLSSAVRSSNHVAKKYSFSAEETVVALQKLALNDENKKTIVEAGALPILTNLLTDDKRSSAEEQYETINCIWTLAFLDDNKNKIINEPGLINAVKRLKIRSKSDARGKIHKACDSLLFILEIEKISEDDEIKTEIKTKHVMLSYNWEVQQTMIKLRDYLRQKGYEVWMDVDKMQDSILSAMAEAVENSAIVLVAITESYKNSNPCRTEAEYAYRRAVPILPLLLQSGYTADGWLGAMIGTKLYVDLSGRFHEKKFDEVNQQITRIILSAKGSKPKSDDAEFPQQINMKKVGSNLNEEHGDTCGFSIVHCKTSCGSWSQNEVSEWFKTIGINETRYFPKMDGQSLSQLCKMLLRSPDNYYSMLREDFHFDAENVLLFTSAIENLFQ